MGCRRWWAPAMPPPRSRMASGFVSMVGGASSRCCRHEHGRRTTVTLTAAEVAEIMRLVEQSTFDELSLEIDGIKLTLRRAGASGKITRNVTTAADAADAADADGAAKAAQAATATEATN